jgi:hypothetical protein
MLKIYCSECGSPTEYSLNKPKFCSHCGASFDSKYNINLKSDVAIKKQNIYEKIGAIEDEDDSDVDASIINNIKRLDFEVSSVKLPKNKIKDIAGTSQGRERSEKGSRKKMSKLEKKRILEEISNESKAIRPKKH